MSTASPRRLLLPFLVVAFLAVSTCVVGVGWAVLHTDRWPKWDDDALSPAEAASVFDVALPPTTLAWRSRTHGGLQTWSFEVLTRLHPEDRPWLLGTNRLTPSHIAVGELNEDVQREIQRVGAPRGQPRLIRFELPQQDTLERWLVLIEYDDQLWVWLDSMDLERG
ncbi:MAG: hypothetical protein Q8L14_41620 [Myxococcales bacterium]|nr:hypothetical protein [Myxococcales bacterium]